MKRSLILFLLCLSLFTKAQNLPFNIDAETLDGATKTPKGWTFGFNDQQKKAYLTRVDSAIKYTGRYAISVEKKGNEAEFFAIDYPIYKVFEGKNIELRGYIKTSEVNSGYAGLWMRIDGKDGHIEFDNMQSRGVKGNKDWLQYSIKLNYDAKQARAIHVGGLLVGDGKVWFDGFEVFIDDKPISTVPEKTLIIKKAEQDTAFSASSGISHIQISPIVQQNLFLTGQFWAFLKYHHPSIANGEYNWDAELFRHLPQIISAKNNKELSQALELWLDQMPGPLNAKKTTSISSKELAFHPDYGSLLETSVLSKSLVAKLTAIRQSEKPAEHYYLSFMPGVGNPKFENERGYVKMAYPDAGYRLLCLYRYWAMINYFFPYKDVIGTDWNKTLYNSIPEFINAKDQQDYTLSTLKLIASIHDTHANIWSFNSALNDFKGKYKLPFQAEFIEDQLVVTGYSYGDTLGVKNKFHIGDIISSINGKPINELLKYYLPYTPASNYDTQLRDLPGNFLLRSNVESFSLQLLRAGKTITETTGGLAANYYPKNNPKKDIEGFKLLNNEIGYVFPGKYKNSDLPAIKTLFKNTKGIIVDMRCYPSEFMPFTFGQYLKSSSTPFVKFTQTQFTEPGLFTYTELLSNGGDGADAYNGKVIIIVNASSQSQAEYTTMAFQSAKQVKVIGSTTAGADGNISPIILPGGISTMISGIGIYYPDGRPTQRVGVKIDRVLKPTIKGMIAGNDELLESAKDMILNWGDTK